MRAPIPLSLETAVLRVAGSLSRVAGRGGGTTLPGKMLWKLDPGAIDRLAGRLPQGTALVSATNGKTTSAAMVAEILRPRVRIAHNSSGANLVSGIASALLQADAAELGLFEVDEAALPEVARRLRPRALLLGNLFRDQLDRYGELELVAARWRDATAALPDAELVVNGDDPQVGDLARNHRARVFGVDDPRLARPALQHAADSKYCLRCGTPYDYAAAYVGHLGDYRCPNCGHARPPLDVVAREIELHGLDGASFTLVAPEGTARVELALPGLYNVYNALGAGSLALTLGAPLAEVGTGLERFSAAFGRFERITIGDRRLLMLLVKNPAGANEAVRTLVEGRAPTVAVIALNDAIADGRDVSWIWDVDFEPLLAGPRPGRRHRHASRRACASLRLRRTGPRADRGHPVARVGARSRARAHTGRRRARPPPDLHGDARAAAGRRGTRPRRELLGERSVKIRVGHLYPDYLNIYADRGNIAVLAERARVRGHELDVRAIGMRDPVPAARSTSSTSAAVRIASRRSSRTISPSKAEPLREAAEAGAAFLAVCGGYQLLGRSYRDVAGDELPGIGLLPLQTVAGQAADDRRRAARLRLGRADARRLREPRRTDDPRRRRGAARACRLGLRQRRRLPASKAAAVSACTARTSTARCCRATRGSRTTCWPRRSPTPAGRPDLPPLADELEHEAHAVSAASARARGGRF